MSVIFAGCTENRERHVNQEPALNHCVKSSGSFPRRHKPLQGKAHRENNFHAQVSSSLEIRVSAVNTRAAPNDRVTPV